MELRPAVFIRVTSRERERERERERARKGRLLGFLKALQERFFKSLQERAIRLLGFFLIITRADRKIIRVF